MPVTTLRLTAAEKRRFAAAARRQGLALSAYLRDAGHAATARTDWKAFFAANPPAPLPARAPSDLSAREGFGR